MSVHRQDALDYHSQGRRREIAENPEEVCRYTARSAEEPERAAAPERR